ncbi:hypothetical protein B0H14DRAFT_2795378 [Mycena olivaceomarginata]|nr:hypothetical protein B0H14DRAFT_2795378 [Mycena olivaceomarginata]
MVQACISNILATKTKTATKTANTKTKKPDADVEKPKREPTAYNIFIATNLPKWNAANPDRKKDGMAAMGKLWAEADENPNKGKPVVKRTKKAKEPKDDTKKATKSKSTTKGKPKKKVEEKEEVEEEDDDDEEKENEIQSSDD